MSWFEVQLLCLLLGNSLFAGRAGSPAVSQPPFTQLSVAVLWFPNQPAGLLYLPPASHRTGAANTLPSSQHGPCCGWFKVKAASGETGAGAGGHLCVFPRAPCWDLGTIVLEHQLQPACGGLFRAQRKQSLPLCRQTSSPWPSSSEGLAMAVG